MTPTENPNRIDPEVLKSVLEVLKQYSLSGFLTEEEEKLEEFKEEFVHRYLNEISQEVPLSNTGMHKTWKNQIANQVVEPLYYFKPNSLITTINGDPNSVVGILQRSLLTGNKVKAAGSGHSYSDVATTPDFFVDTHALNAPSDASKPIYGQLSQSSLKAGSLNLVTQNISWPNYDPENNHALFETEAGIKICDLNNVLCARGVGLMNMGGYDGQTIMGAISTSTHGSGITLPPFPDMLRSLVLITTGKWNGTTIGGGADNGGVYMYRIEPTNGITDPTKYNDPNIALIQDDDCFNSVICSMGCMGIVYSIVIEVMQKYWLSETRTITTLDKVMAMLSSPAGSPGDLPLVLQQVRNFEVLVHPYPMKGLKVVEMDPTQPPETYYPYFKCLVTERHIAPDGPPSPDTKPRNFIVQLMSMFKLSFEMTVLLLNTFPKLTPAIINTALSGLEDTDYLQIYWKIYDLGLSADAGFAAEIGFALEDANGKYTNENFKAAVDKIHMVAQNSRVNGLQYQTSPFSLRFVKSSNAHLSMMQGMNTCMIEMDMITGTYGGPEIMMRYQNNMYAIGGRPHWGLEFDNLSGANNMISDMYPKLDKWMQVYNQFNSQGTFNNRFTDRVGFTKHQFVR
jgi:D-arabinono-1,4-lactone oxidase